MSNKKNGKAGGRYGYARGKLHNGLDLSAEPGTAVFAMFDCRVTFVDNQFDPNVLFKYYNNVYKDVADNIKKAGNRVWLESTLSDGRTLEVKFFHLNSINVQIGEWINAGEIVALSGTTGNASSPDAGPAHLHIEIRIDGEKVNPEEFIYTIFDEEGNKQQ